MKRLTITIWVSIAVAACVAQPSQNSDGDPRTAALEMPLSDGNWRYYYPDGAHVLAEGRVSKGRRVGQWIFYYPTGIRFAQGTFDGLLDGKWILWKPDGSISHERSCTKCEDFASMWSPAGSDDFPLTLFPRAQFESVLELLPSSGGWWSGTGYYEEGLWKRELTDEELR